MCDLAVEQISNGLRDDGLAVAGGPVDEHRVAGVDGRAELIEHALADDEVREGLLNRSRVATRGAAFLKVAMYCRYWSSGTGAAPTYWLLSRKSCARSRPASVMRYRYDGPPSEAPPDTST